MCLSFLSESLIQKCCGIFLVTRYYCRFISHANECTLRPRPVVVDDLFIVCLPIMEEEIN